MSAKSITLCREKSLQQAMFPSLGKNQAIMNSFKVNYKGTIHLADPQIEVS